MKKIIMAAALIWVINLNVHAWQKAVDAVVAQDGTGDYTSLIDAVNAIPFHHEGQYIVYVKAGTYRGHVHIPRSLTRISIIGDGMDQVFITDNQVSGGPKAVPVERAATVVDLANDTYFEGISFVNSWGHEQRNGPQALALYTLATRVILNRCGMWSYQDTYRTANNANDRNFLRHCTIEGGVDFIYGNANVWFDSCKLVINRKQGGYIVAPRHKPETRWGYVFNHTLITAPGNPAETTVWLGRPWHDYPKTVFLHTRTEVNIPPEGWWPNMGGWPTIFADYGTVDAAGRPVDLSRRISSYWALNQHTGDTIRCTAKNRLTEAEAALYTIRNVMSGDDGWDPNAFCKPLPAVRTRQKGRRLTWHPVSGARGYVILHDRKAIAFTTDTKYRLKSSLPCQVKAISPNGVIGQ